MVVLASIGVCILLFVFLPFLLRIRARKDETGVTLHASLAVCAGAIGVAVSYGSLPQGAHLGEVPGKVPRTSPPRKAVRFALTAFGRGLFSFSPPQEETRAKGEKKEKRRQGAEAKKKEKRHLRDVWASVCRGRDLFGRFRKPGFSFLRSLFRAFRIRSIRGDLTFGTGDPALTGMIFGGMMALTDILGARFRLDAHPDFAQERIEGTLAIKALIKPHRLLWALLGLGARLLWGEVSGWMARRWADRKPAGRTVPV
ncbi:MAG: DUF2953 domain-containing protein [Candidatus Latescibacterota bacterium]